MKRKLLGWLFALLLVLSAPFSANSVSAVGIPESFRDLSAYGLPVFSARRLSSAPQLDGVGKEEEYGADSDLVSWGNGLHITSYGLYGGEEDACALYEAAASSSVLEARIRYDDSLVWVFLSLKEGESPLFRPITHPTVGECYALSVSFSLYFGEDPIVATSYLTNQYFFSPETLQPLGMMGTRILQSRTSPPRLLANLSSFSDSSASAGYVDAAGTIWNAKALSDSSAMSVRKENGESRFSFEFCFPLGDLMQTLSSEDQIRVKEGLQTGTEAFCGRFLPQFLFPDSVGNSYLAYASAISGNTPVPWDASQITWKEWIAEQYPAVNGGNCVVEAVPAPLWWGKAEEPKEDPVPEVPQDPAPLPPETAPVPTDPAPLPPETAPAPPQTLPTTPETVPSTSENPIETEDFLDRLPPESYEFPESLEIIPDGEKPSSSSSSSPFGGYLSVLGGVLLLLAALLSLIRFQKEDRRRAEEREALKEKLQRKKDSPESKK